MISPEPSGECPPFTILCRSNLQADQASWKVENKICVQGNIENPDWESQLENCPITSIEITPIIKQTDDHEQRDYVTFDESSIKFGKDPDNLPLTIFRLNNGEPCNEIAS